jgi:uracil-DNA glycosylase
VWESWSDRDAVITRVHEARQTKTIFPAEDRMFAAFQTPLSAVRVVLLAQDPYHGAGQAMGLAFSVPQGVKVPPSLRNIQKEYEADVGKRWLGGGDLTAWAKQGVLLLNTVLTVEEGKANSHKDVGWDGWVSAVLRAVTAANPRLVFLAWGKPAQAVVKRLPLGPDHHVLKAAHPSPLSASHGFFGSRPFTKANALLEEAIEW